MIITRGFGQGQWIIVRGLNYYRILSIVRLASFIRLRLEVVSKLYISDIILKARISVLEHHKSEIATVVQLPSKIKKDVKLKSSINKEILLQSKIRK